MAETSSACPRGSSALAQVPVATGYSHFMPAYWSMTHVPGRPMALAASVAILALALSTSPNAGSLREPLLVIMLIVAFAGLTRPRAQTLYRIFSLFESSAPKRDLAPSLPPATQHPAAFEPSPRPLSALRNDGRIQDTTWTSLLAQVSHELRTPLNAVIGFSDVMDSELLGPVGHPRYREYARHIRDCGRELLKSAEDTLAITSLLAHPELRGCPSPLSLSSLAADSWAFFAGATQNRRLSLDIVAPDGLELVGDRRPLRQILINLFAEAIDRSTGDDAILLKASVEGDLVHLEMLVRAPADNQARPVAAGSVNPSLAMCMARTLLELQGATLVDTTDATGAWRAATVLRRAVQSDFFELAESRDFMPAHAC